MIERLAAVLMLLVPLVHAFDVRAQEAPTPEPPGIPGRDPHGNAMPAGVHRDTLLATAPQPFLLQSVVVPGSESLSIDGVRADTSRYRMDYRYGRVWITGLSGQEHVVIDYRTLPFQLRDAYRIHAITYEDPTAEERIRQAGSEAARQAAFPTASSLQHSGSITRGVLAGNRRDVTLESGLRMQLSGEIVDGVNVQAVLTDENTPILPEGTTQRLEEFDRVFIGLDAAYGSAQLGDFDLQFASSEFARFSRKLQGAAVTTSLPAGPLLAGGSAIGAGAIARGTFQSQRIEPIDGVQGPYRLEGSQGERFILVVPGSEIVYVDGGRLTRGETNDYTIDYATAELTFTAGVIVTSSKRIRVDFQYTTHQFTRTLVASQVESHFWQRPDGAGRLRLGASVIREADGREFSEEFGFSLADSLALARAGDGIAASSGAIRVLFDPEAPFVQYRREIRPGPDGRTDTIFVALDHAPPEEEPVFRVHFSRVGSSEGSYVRVGRSVNGILYEYRGPGAGEYLPLRILPKPKLHQIVDLTAALEAAPGLELFGEWARSVHDRNRMSVLDADDNHGDAYLMGVRMQPMELGPTRVSAVLRRRFVAGSFEAFDRIRPVEFEREWNLLSRSVTATGGVIDGGDETIDEGRVLVEAGEGTSLHGAVGRLHLAGAFEGVRRSVGLQSEEARFPHVDLRTERIESRDGVVGENGLWVRNYGEVRYPLREGRLVPGISVESEDRRQRLAGTDSLAGRSFRFVEYRPGVTWERDGLEVGTFLELRREEELLGAGLEDASRSWTAQTRFRYRASATFDVDGNVGYRSRRFSEPFRAAGNANVESVILRWNGRYHPLQRALEVNWLYEGTSERTPTMQEIYVRTGPGIGQYVWEDANGDGIIQIDEMVPARLPNEGTYVRTYVPSDSLVPVVHVQARVRLEFTPARLWRSPTTGLQRWLASVATRSVVEVREKTRDPALTRVYALDLGRYRQPGHTINGRVRVAQDVFLFRNRTNYGLDLSFNQLRSLAELSAGEERRFVNLWRMEGRARPAPDWGLRLVAAVERNRLVSQTFASRRYDLKSLRLEPEVSYAISQFVQIVAATEFGRKADAIGDRSAHLAKLPLEIRFTRPRLFQVSTRVEVANVDMRGTAVGMAQYELTDGRGPGTSYMWSLRGQYTVNEHLRATFSYDGRRPSAAPVVHTMRVQLSANF